MSDSKPVIGRVLDDKNTAKANRGGMAMLRTLTALLILTALAPVAHAQGDYPNRTITLVVPLPPGGTNDIMARAIADKLSASLGQQVVVENRAAGGNGTVGTRQVAKGPADGYRLLLGYTSTLATSPHMLNVGYDVRKDFAPLGLIASAPALLLVHPGINIAYAQTIRGV
jgi:tripartite-type tricarboxylate transporter receptor subunit TctC